jgi:RNA polymerase sigma-70 factor (ECF subfamily)
MEQQNRLKLIRKAIEGDEQALGTLLEDYRPFLRILARRQLDSVMAPRVDPSDLVQQVCLEVHRDLPEFRGEHEREFIAWIRRILENSVRDSIQMHIGAQKRSVYREQRTDDFQEDNAVAPTHRLAANQPSPSSRVMRGEMAIRLAAEIECLPEDQREAVRLRHLEGWSLKDLASHFDRSESAVAGLLKRGLRSLRKQLADLD